MSEKNVINVVEVIQKIKTTTAFLFKKKLIILVFTLIGATIGLIYAAKKKPLYYSSLSFVVEGESTSGLAGLASTFGLGKVGPNQGMFNSANILDLLKSRSLVQKALLKPLKNNSKRTFADLYIEFSEWKEDWKDQPDLKNIHFEPETELKSLTAKQLEVLTQIHSSIVTDQINVEIKNPDNTIIYLDVNSANEEFSRHFPEQLMKVVSEYYIETKTRKAKLNYQVLKIQTDSVRRELNNAITGVASANDNTFLLNPAFNVKRVPSAHKEVSVQANQAILSELVKNLELSRMNLLNETPFIEIIDTPVSPINPKKFGKIRGIVLGGAISMFVIVAFLILQNYLKNLYKEATN
jgi:uncharacterized protein involved in exopolysaccharide biosynthesis